MRASNFDWDRVLDEKRGFCSYLHKYADRSVANRTRFFHELNRRKKVDSGGRAMNNMGFEIPGTAGRAKMEFLAKYRFHIAFENRLAPGWTTEKFTDPFEVYSIPIYWGDSRALQWFNPKAFVNVSDFRNFSDCCDYILHLENSREDYAGNRAAGRSGSPPPMVLALHKMASGKARSYPWGMTLKGM
ncbi:MAG: hypothetical protein EBS60_07370 [Verrucomicrobia bacterium]|nr:hypothetical protein [Verrucomicrobiota bacterium]